MTQRIKEQLSAFLDGELPETESALLLKRLERDDELRGALSRYSLIGAVMRADGDAPAARQVAARVSAAIAREPARSSRGALAWPAYRLLRPLAGVAVAAGVAALGLMLAQRFDAADPAERVPALAQSEVEPITPVAADVSPDDSPARPYTTPPAVAGPGSIPAAQFANYLVAHSSYASPLVRRSVVAGLIMAPDDTPDPGGRVTDELRDGP